MGLFRLILFILEMKIIHFGEIYRLISFDYFIKYHRLNLKDLSILDVGFNKGLFRWYFTDLHGCLKYSGVEIDRNFLDIYPNTFYHNFERNKLNKYYDFIFCSHVLEHINDDHQFLKNMACSLNDQNGKLLLRVAMPTDEKIPISRMLVRGFTPNDRKPSTVVNAVIKIGGLVFVRVWASCYL